MADEAVKVVVRCRPMNSKEVTEGRKSVINMQVNESQVTITNPDTTAISQDPKSFTFDAVYDDMSTQRAVYDETAYPLVESVLSGYNGTIFAVRLNNHIIFFFLTFISKFFHPLRVHKHFLLFR